MFAEPERCDGSGGRERPRHGDCADSLPEDLLDAALAQQRQDWIAGRRIPVAERLRQHPALAHDPAHLAELVYHEFALRQELGESLDWEEYVRQFPEQAARLGRLRMADQIVGEALVPAGSGRGRAAACGEYEILGEVGHGGMSVVLKARQRSLDRVVALKMLWISRIGEAASEEERQRFHKEAQAVARLQHPNIVQIYEVGEAGGQPFLSLEFVEGGSLADRLARTPLPAAAAAALVESLARAMEFAHGRGIVHRDLKPSNVLLAGESAAPPEHWVPKVTDFGLAKRLDGEGDTRTNAVLGTPSYMAPEQAGGPPGAIDRRTDVYGLGAILYECLTGRPPFKAATPLETLAQVKDQEPVAPSRLNAVVGRDIETICLKCLEKDPARRYATAEDLADELGRFQRSEPIRARPVGLLGRARRWGRRNPTLAALLVLLMAVVAGALTGLTLLWQRSEDQHAQAEQSDEEAVRLLTEFVRAGEAPVPEGFAAHSDRQLDLLRRAEIHGRGRLARRAGDPAALAALAGIYAAMSRIHADCERSSEAEECLRRAEETLTDLPPGAEAPPELLARLVGGYDHLGELYNRHGQAVPGVEAHRRAGVLAEGLARRQSGPAALAALAENRLKVSGTSMHFVAVSAADLTRHAEAVQRWRGAVGDGDLAPEMRRRIADAYLHLGMLHEEAGQPMEATRCWRVAAEEAGKVLQRDGAGLEAKTTRARACWQLARRPDIEPYYSEAVCLFEQIADEQRARAEQDPTSIPLQHGLIETLSALAQCHSQAGDAVRAARTFALVARQREGLLALLSGPLHEVDRIDELCQLCSNHLDAGNRPAALTRARQAGEAFDRYTAPGRAGFSRREMRADRLWRIASCLRKAGAPLDNALARAEAARRLFEELVSDSPKRLDLAYGLHKAWEEIGKTHITAKRFEDAVRAWSAGVEVLRGLVAIAPDVHLYRRDMGLRCMRLGAYCRGQGKLAEAERWFLEQEALWPKDAEILREVARELASLAAQAKDGSEKQGYQAESDRVARAADAAGRR